MSPPRISVIIPVYNGEKYLPRTLDSLLRQAFRDFEVLCINDCSTDSSDAILKRYAEADPRIRALATPSNQGIVARVINRHGLPSVRGERFVYASQDDLFSEDWLQGMHERAIETGADAVLPDLVFFREGDTARNRALIGVRGDRGVVLSGREAVTLSLDWEISTNALWSTSLVKRLGYFEFGMNADEYSARVFFLECNKVVFSRGEFFYRQDNPEAITKKLSVGQFDTPYTGFRIFELLRDNAFDPEICAKELRKAVLDLFRKKQLLLSDGARLSIPQRAEAEIRLRRCFDSITGSASAVEVLRRRRGGLKDALSTFSLLRGYSAFSWFCRLAVLARRLRWTRRRSKRREPIHGRLP